VSCSQLTAMRTTNEGSRNRALASSGFGYSARMSARFVDKQEITSIDSLSAVQREQLRLAGKAYDGEDLPAEQRIGDEEPALFRLTLWRVVDGDDHLYDAWLYQVDSGSFFRANTAEDVGGIIQFGLECQDDAIANVLGPAMVEAGLLPHGDSEYKRFAAMLADQKTKP
jgi:hypothetical protein